MVGMASISDLRPDRQSGRARAWVARATALIVALVVALLSLPHALSQWWLGPDVIEHLAIANAWIHGAGFVDPVLTSYYLNRSVPLPAFATRAAVTPMLAAVAFALGATLPNIFPLHALWSSCIAGVTVLVGRRFMRLPAAVGAAVVIVLSPAWLYLARFPLTEITAFGSYLLFLWTARGVTRSVRGALFCAIATVVAWATRANFIALFPAVLVAAVLEIGPRRSIRCRSLWAYLLCFVVLYELVCVSVTAWTGLAPYARYADSGQFFEDIDLMHYKWQYPGAWAFVAAHWDEVSNRIALNVSQYRQVLFFDSIFHYVGWLMPAAFYALVGPGTIERRINALAALGFSVALILDYSHPFDAYRYPLWTAVSSCFCGFVLLDDLAAAIERALSRHALWGARLARAAPLVGALSLVSATTVSSSIASSHAAWQSYQRGDPVYGPSFWDPSVVTVPMCRYMNKDAIVAGPNPWSYTLWCGNAALELPPDLDSEELQQRFLRERHPRYLISAGTDWLATSPQVRLVTTIFFRNIYEVREPGPESRPWNAPPPLVCLGRDPECTRRDD